MANSFWYQGQQGFDEVGRNKTPVMDIQNTVMLATGVYGSVIMNRLTKVYNSLVHNLQLINIVEQ